MALGWNLLFRTENAPRAFNYLHWERESSLCGRPGLEKILLETHRGRKIRGLKYETGVYPTMRNRNIIFYSGPPPPLPRARFFLYNTRACSGDTGLMFIFFFVPLFFRRSRAVFFFLLFFRVSEWERGFVCVVRAAAIFSLLYWIMERNDECGMYREAKSGRARACRKTRWFAAAVYILSTRNWILSGVEGL